MLVCIMFIYDIYGSIIMNVLLLLFIYDIYGSIIMNVLLLLLFIYDVCWVALCSGS